MGWRGWILGARTQKSKKIGHFLVSEAHAQTQAAQTQAAGRAYPRESDWGRLGGGQDGLSFCISSE